MPRCENASFFGTRSSGTSSKKGTAQPTAGAELTFDIHVTDAGKTRGRRVQQRIFGEWKTIGQIAFKEAVASHNGDFVIHLQGAPRREDCNDPLSLARSLRHL